MQLKNKLNLTRCEFTQIGTKLDNENFGQNSAAHITFGYMYNLLLLFGGALSQNAYGIL